MLPKEVEKRIGEIWDKEIMIFDMDLCSIFSNLIQNAIEALEKVKTDKKYLFINLEQGKSYARFEIRNSIEKRPERDQDGNIITTKDDKKNHGFGLINIRTIIEENKGKFEIEIRENECRCTVILKNKVIGNCLNF
ncbi:MAG: GHKL domain-containing protein [Clostridiales bacterium]|nr:GHKL domain-containing protein [Clostridiales bacterium]